MNKPCSICKHILPLELFGKDKHKKDGLTASCKPCSKLVRNGYRQPKVPPKTEKLCKCCNTVKPIADYYKHTCTCKLCISRKNYANRVPKAPKPLSNRTASVYKRLRRQQDSLFKLRSNISTLIANSLSRNNYIKSSTTESILGCTFLQFKAHIESQFTTGMSWDNRADWHIDHIVPVSYASTEQELLQLNHYTNLRPLWATDNLQKAASITEDTYNHPLYKQLQGV